jgi:glutamate-ammonia-ligase adenylyltransferase
MVVRAASRSLGRLLDTDPDALIILERLDTRPAIEDESEDALVRWKQHELLRIAARDLTGIDALEAVGAALSELAGDVLQGALRLAGGADQLAVIAMGKLGGGELNYASDIDVMFVGEGEPQDLDRVARAAADVVRRCFRLDLNLRPEGRNGALVRTLASYEAYWDKWAEAWEFQALLKARAVAGSTGLGAAFEASAEHHLWERRFTPDDLRAVRAMKVRTEAGVARRGNAERELKLGPGGIRDVEFAVQLLQLVHGGADPQLRVRPTLRALDELAAGGYVATDDAVSLADAYRFLRTVEHRLQLDDERQVHAIPGDDVARDRLARVLGYEPLPTAGAAQQLDVDVLRHQTITRAIHERLWFRPILDELTNSGERVLTEEVAATRLAAFGFTDAERTRVAITELTRGLTRSSRLMQQLLPLLLDWLSVTPDPDLGLLGLRHLASGDQRSMELATAFRESPEVANRLVRLLGTSRWLIELLRHNPDLINSLGNHDDLRLRSRAELVAGTRAAVGWRGDPAERQSALHRFTDRERLRIAAHDVLDLIDVADVGRALSDLAEATLEAAVHAVAPTVPFAVLAAGRLGGGELSYASDLDVLFIYDGAAATDFEAAERAATELLRFVGGTAPHIWTLDTRLRPEGRDGPLARSVEGLRSYVSRWAQPWERLAMVRVRPVAGDPAVGAEALDVLEQFVWRADGLSSDERREIRRIKARVESERIPTGEDPQFHLKLGRGALYDIEFCTQLLQLDRVIPSTGTIEALGRLQDAEVLTAEEREVLQDAYRFCEQARNRWFLVGSGAAPNDSLPTRADDLAKLARSLDTTPTRLRDDYRRVARRARRVVEQRFYGSDANSTQ